MALLLRTFINKKIGNINKKKLLIFTLTIYTMCILIFFLNEIIRSKQAILSEVDAKLRSAAVTVNYIIPIEFQDVSKNKVSVTPDIDKNNTLGLAKYADEVGVKYIYSFVMIGDKIYFTSSSSTKEEIAKDDVLPYMTEYKDASTALKRLFKSSSDELIEVTYDDWGYFRSILRKYKTSSGITYVTGADLEVASINKMYIYSFAKSLAVAISLLLAFIPIVFQYEKISRLEVDNNINRKKLEKLEIDEITGLPYIEKLWVENQEIKCPSIFLLGINNLKVISSHYGDETVNKILKHVSTMLIAIQENGLKGKVYKVGLDEYAVILDDEKSREDIYIIGEDLLENFYNNPYVDNNGNIIMTVLVGAASSGNENIDNLEDNLVNLKRVFLEARMALNYAYEKKLRLFIYDDSEINDLSSAANEIFWSNKIASAIKDKRIGPYFQPILNIKTGKVEKYESLMRLFSRDGKVITPYFFLDISHKIGLYHKLTNNMIYNSFKFFSDKNIEFSVNISVKDILDETTKRIILYNVKRFHNPKLIVFEILESEGVTNFSEIISFIKIVKDIGCKVAIDDFGIGYSNFDRLSKLEIDYIKIDGSLIKSIDTNKNNEILVQMIVAFSKKLGIETIAEFVHSESVYKKVKELGVDYAQGYYIGEPLPNLLPDDYKLEKEIV